MPLHWGPGPVFIHESIAATRRWQFYASRSFFVLGLLAGLAVAWLAFFAGHRPQDQLTIKQLALLGQYFYFAIATVQLTLVLLVAPVATADAICLDRARGNLTHMFVTDLSSAEIVLGKLAARLVPILALMAATVPVLALAGLLGGIVLEAIVTLTLLTLMLAMLECSMALAISVRATKTHEVLMAVYGIEGAWVMGPILWAILHAGHVVPQVPQWYWTINPYVLAWAPYVWPGVMSTAYLARLMGGVLALSAGLVASAVLQIRPAERNRSGLSGGPGASRLARACRRLLAWRRQPSLDDNPVLWRECRRGRPSWLAKVVWGLFIALSLAGTAGGIVTIADRYQQGLLFLGMVSAFQATFGLLLVSLAAPTALAEERVRGSLDVLLASPLSTNQIVLAKWWGAYRNVPALALLPAIGALCVAAADPRFSAGINRSAHEFLPLSALDRIAIVVLPLAMLLAQGAVITSIGLALAVWFRRVGRAVAFSVASYAFAAFGWIALLELGVIPMALSSVGLLDPKDHDTVSFVDTLLARITPFGAQSLSFEAIEASSAAARNAEYLGSVIMLLATLGFALLVLAITLATFDRCLGRVPERPRRAPRLPRRVLASAADSPLLTTHTAGHDGPPKHIRHGMRKTRQVSS